MVCQNDETSHWEECSCGYKNSVEEHKYSSNTIKEPTNTEVGLVEYVCSVCGHSKVEEIPVIVNKGCSGSVNSLIFIIVSVSALIVIFIKKKRMI